MLETFTTAPPSFMRRNASRVKKKAPIRSTWSTLSQSSAVCCSRGLNTIQAPEPLNGAGSGGGDLLLARDVAGTGPRVGRAGGSYLRGRSIILRRIEVGEHHAR